MSRNEQQAEATTAVDYSLLKITSTAFENESPIPAKYSCDADNVNPPLTIGNIPGNAVSLALIMEDNDAPAGTWIHWLAWNIPVTHHIKENSKPGLAGLNDYNKHPYCGPCPPSGTHRYHFKIYALDTILDLDPNARKQQLEAAMSGNIIAFGTLTGSYERKQQAAG